MTKEQLKTTWNAAIKRNTFESDLMKWMNLESIQQRSKSERKNKYRILKHIYGI